MSNEFKNLEEKEYYWKTADGRYILYKDLIDDHLINICRYLKRYGYELNMHLHEQLYKRKLDPNKFYFKIWLRNLWYRFWRKQS